MVMMMVVVMMMEVVILMVVMMMEVVMVVMVVVMMVVMMIMFGGLVDGGGYMNTGTIHHRPNPQRLSLCGCATINHRSHIWSQHDHCKSFKLQHLSAHSLK